MKIPGIDGLKGLFEIFVPGLFLFFNINFFFLLSLPNAFELTFDQILAWNESIEVLNSGVFWLFLFVISYMLGIVLRTFKPDRPDYISAMLRRIFSDKALKKDLDKAPGFFVRLQKNFNSQVESSSDIYRAAFTNEFPYIEWLGDVVVKRMPAPVDAFYQKTWGAVFKTMQARNVDDRTNKQFLNLTKVLLYSNSNHLSDELHSVESHTRYISGLFYALYFSFLLLAIPFIKHGISFEWHHPLSLWGIWAILATEIIIILVCFALQRGYRGLVIFVASLFVDVWFVFRFSEVRFEHSDFVSFIVFSIMLIYLVSLLTILWKFRTIRIREIDHIFAASFADPQFWKLTQDHLSFHEFYKLWVKK